MEGDSEEEEIMTKTVQRKALFHKPTGKWVMIDMADALYGFAVDGIEEATLYQDDVTLKSALDGVDLQFAQVDLDDFELKDVEVTYQTKE